MVDRETLRTTLRADAFNATDACLIQERCVSGPGMRRVLRFSTVIANVGCADFVVGVPTESSPRWSWHSCHMHWHFVDYAHYALRDFCDASAEVAWEDRPVVGHKNGWCVRDLSTFGFNASDFVYDGSRLLTRNLSTAGPLATQWRSGRTPRECPNQFNCAQMGISPGCFDVYDHWLDCQWIDVTDTAAGVYWLSVDVNWNSARRVYTSPENDYSNNEASVAVQLAQDGSVTVLSDSEIAAADATLCTGRKRNRRRRA